MQSPTWIHCLKIEKSSYLDCNNHFYIPGVQIWKIDWDRLNKNGRSSKVWLTDRPFYSPGFELGAKNWSISRVQHWLNNFGPFAKVLAVDGQTWHSLQSDIRHAWSESLRSQHQAIPGRVCRPTGNISLNEQRQFFLVIFCPLMTWGTCFWTNW